MSRKKKSFFSRAFRQNLHLGDETESGITDSQLDKMWKSVKVDIALRSGMRGILFSGGAIMAGAGVAYLTGDVSLANQLWSGSTGIYSLIGMTAPTTLIFNGFAHSRIYKNPARALVVAGNGLTPVGLRGYREFIIKNQISGRKGNAKQLTISDFMQLKAKENAALEARAASIQKSIESTKKALESKPEEPKIRLIEPIAVEGSNLSYDLSKSKDVNSKSQGYSAALSSFSTVKSEWFEWESDILKVVKYPSLFDLNEPATLNFHKALAYAESITPEKTDKYDILHPFNRAVSDVKIAWQAAVSNAEKVRLARFNVEEKARLVRALDLLNLALNSASSPAERQAAYQRAMVQMEGLVVVPRPALNSLEGFIHYGELLGR